MRRWNKNVLPHHELPFRKFRWPATRKELFMKRSFWSYFYDGHEDGTCHQCNGSDIHCPACGGTGFFADRRTLQLGEEFEVIETVQFADNFDQ